MSEYEWLNEFSTNLNKLMREAGYTQKELAEDTGLAESTISRYMKGTQVPKATAIVNIASVLLCDIDELIDFGEDIVY